jgi:hypothetical protein
MSAATSGKEGTARATVGSFLQLRSAFRFSPAPVNSRKNTEPVFAIAQEIPKIAPGYQERNRRASDNNRNSWAHSGPRTICLNKNGGRSRRQLQFWRMVLYPILSVRAQAHKLGSVFLTCLIFSRRANRRVRAAVLQNENRSSPVSRSEQGIERAGGLAFPALRLGGPARLVPGIDVEMHPGLCRRRDEAAQKQRSRDGAAEIT